MPGIVPCGRLLKGIKQIFLVEIMCYWEKTDQSVQSLSHVRLFSTLWTAAHQASLSITNSRSYSNSCPLSQWCHPTISASVVPFCSRLQSFLASGSFQQVGTSHQVAKILELQLQHQSFQWTPRTDSFRMDWLDLLAGQGTLKSLHHHSSKASVLQHSAFFIIQLSHPYMTTGKIIALTRWTFVGKVMSLLFNKLPRLVIAFLPRSRHLLI